MFIVTWLRNEPFFEMKIPDFDQKWTVAYVRCLCKCLCKCVGWIPEALKARDIYYSGRFENRSQNQIKFSRSIQLLFAFLHECARWNILSTPFGNSNDILVHLIEFLHVSDSELSFEKCSRIHSTPRLEAKTTKTSILPLINSPSITVPPCTVLSKYWPRV